MVEFFQLKDANKIRFLFPFCFINDWKQTNFFSINQIFICEHQVGGKYLQRRLWLVNPKMVSKVFMSWPFIKLISCLDWVCLNNKSKRPQPIFYGTSRKILVLCIKIISRTTRDFSWFISDGYNHQCFVFDWSLFCVFLFLKKFLGHLHTFNKHLLQLIMQT